MKFPLLLGLSLATLGITWNTAHAQREPISREDRRAQRRAMIEKLTPEQRVQYFQNQWQQRYQAASPEQKARMDEQRKGFEARLREQGIDPNDPKQLAQLAQDGAMQTLMGGGQNGAATPTDVSAQMRVMMNAAGISEKPIQDAIIAFVGAQDKARQPLLVTAREVATTLNDPGADPEQVGAKWATYQSALEADKERFQTDLSALDTQINWSKTPRLQAFLSLVGVLSSDASVVGGPAAIFASDPPAAAPPINPTETAPAPAPVAPAPNNDAAVVF